MKNTIHRSKKKEKKTLLRAVERIALCRSWRELSHEYLIAKIGLGIAENEPCEAYALSNYRSRR